VGVGVRVSLQQQQPAQLRLEAEVEQPVELEQRKHLEPSQHGAPTLDQVEQPARRRDQQFDACAQRLRAGVRARATARGDRQLHACAQLCERLVDRRAAAGKSAAQRGAEHELTRLLHGARRRLARGREYHRTQPAALRGQGARVEHEPRHDRQQQRSRLAVTAGADDESVAPGERDGHDVPLQRRGRLVTGKLEILKQLRRELRQVRRIE
jgi:hypothetical protein